MKPPKSTAIRVNTETYRLASVMSARLVETEGKPDNVRQTGPGHAIRRCLEIVSAHLDNESVILTKDLVARLFRQETALRDEVTQLRHETTSLRDERDKAWLHERETLDKSMTRMKRDGQRIATLQIALESAEERTTAALAELETAKAQARALQDELETARTQARLYAQAGVLLARAYAAELSGDENEELAKSLWQTAAKALEAAMAGETADELAYLRGSAMQLVVDNDRDQVRH